MEEMIYEAKTTPIKYLATGEKDGYKYCAVSYGTHPCCYVQLPDNHKEYGKIDTDNAALDVHGGITYSREKGNPFKVLDKDKHVIGWDYAHLGDYTGHYIDVRTDPYFWKLNLKRWTIKELIQDIFSVIEQLKGIDNDRDYRQI